MSDKLDKKENYFDTTDANMTIPVRFDPGWVKYILDLGSDWTPKQIEEIGELLEELRDEGKYPDVD